MLNAIRFPTGCLGILWNADMADIFDRVESQRVKLENSVQELQKSLQHWQKWEAEYDALREEVYLLPTYANAKHFKQLASDFGSEIVDEREIEELAGFKQNLQRSRDQVAALISRRIDYVQRNRRSVAKQLGNTQAELNGHNPENTPNSDNISISSAEIIEELDEEDNVISGRLAKPGEHVDNVGNLLRIAGVSQDSKSNNLEKQTSDAYTEENKASNLNTPRHESTQPDKPSIKPQWSGRPASQARNKSVTFAEDAKDPVQYDQSSVVKPVRRSDATSDNLGRTVNITKGAFSDDEKVWELDEADRPIDFHSPHIPANESPEDAALRREMLKYGSSDTSAVVAQIDLENDDIDESYFSEDNEEIDWRSSTDDEDNDVEDEDEDEDEHGRSTKQMMSDVYRKEMLELERKLNAQVVQNVGGEKIDHESQTAATSNLRSSLGRPTEIAEGKSRAENKHKTDKVVRFAEDIDVARIDNKTLPIHTSGNASTANTIRQEIVERPRKDEIHESTSWGLGQMGRVDRDTSSSYRGREAADTLASTVIERLPKSTSRRADASVKRVSRFKAARSNKVG